MLMSPCTLFPFSERTIVSNAIPDMRTTCSALFGSTHPCWHSICEQSSGPASKLESQKAASHERGTKRYASVGLYGVSVIPLFTSSAFLSMSCTLPASSPSTLGAFAVSATSRAFLRRSSICARVSSRRTSNVAAINARFSFFEVTAFSKSEGKVLRVLGASTSSASSPALSPPLSFRLYTNKYASDDTYETGASVEPSLGTFGGCSGLFLACRCFPFSLLLSVASFASPPETVFSTATASPNGPPLSPVTTSSSKRHHRSVELAFASVFPTLAFPVPTPPVPHQRDVVPARGVLTAVEENRREFVVVV